jgi:Glycosyl hydrolase family 57
MQEDKIIWANFLHIYQPPTQFPSVLKKIAEESYSKLTGILKANPKAKITLNINGSLTELLDQNGLGVLIEEIKSLALAGQIELVGSAKYHPLLPKLPKDEMKRQIEINNETNRHYFGAAWRPQGFFPPEMAYSKEVAEVAVQSGFKWIILSEYAFPPSIEAKPDNNQIYSIKGLPLKVLFRNHNVSVRVAFGEAKTKSEFFDLVQAWVRPDEYLVTGMDGETFGHHRPGLEKVLSEIYSDGRIEPKLISDLVEEYPRGLEVEPLASSWGLEVEDLKKGIIYPRWDYPGNSIQARQWELTNLAIKSVWGTSKTDPRFEEVRGKLDQALHSDQYWWASGRPNWHFRMVEMGARMLKEVVLSSSGSEDADRILANELYRSIVDLGLKIYGDRIIEAR